MKVQLSELQGQKSCVYVYLNNNTTCCLVMSYSGWEHHFKTSHVNSACFSLVSLHKVEFDFLLLDATRREEGVDEPTRPQLVSLVMFD